MHIAKSFPYEIKEIENIWITMPDGTRLAARMWIPESAENQPVPAIFEYIPYRKRDFKRIRDESLHRYFAGNGYASLRVDIRGSGDSEGLLKDEYLEQELADGENIIRWLREQDWCNGKIGMIGISWGGFNGLQIAARRPKGLEAIISACSTDDRYKDDVHYMGGCLLGDNLSWASVMFGYNSLPPDPEIVGERWKEMWLHRLENNDPWIIQWLRHQQRDDYWKHGSICENYEDIQCPVMAVSGWADGYTNAVFRLVENLKVPRMGLIGPWSHKYPHLGVPGPAIGFLQECVRWWDRWLKNEDTGIDREHKLKVWMQHSVPPTTDYKVRPGFWVGLPGWTANELEHKQYRLGTNHLIEEEKWQHQNKTFWVRSPLRLGLFAGKWCSYNAPPDLPGDQREEDGGALVFDSDFLEEEITILGAPTVSFTFSSEKPTAMLAVRLSDVAPDGKATRVTYGIKNLTHFQGHENPEFLQEDKKYQVEIRMNDIGHVFPKGHRIRLSVSTSYWPLAWTPRELTAVTLYADACELGLPLLGQHDAEVHFTPPERAELSTHQVSLKKPDYKWQVIRDLINDESVLHVLKDSGTYQLEEIGLEVANRMEENYSIQYDNTNSAKGETKGRTILARGDWKIETRHQTLLKSEKDNFIVYASLDAFENNVRIFSKNWHQKIPRKFI